MCRDASAASLYELEKSIPPVEIRKKLEAVGVDVTLIRDLYSLESSIAHVGNPYDQLQIRWEGGGSGKLLIGGENNIPVQKEMLIGIVLTVFRFIKFDEDYIVQDVDAITSVVR